MRYFLIDKVIYLESNSTLKALKNVALSEDVFNDHFYGNPVMPGALQIESLAQAATVLLEVSSGLTQKAILIMIEKAKFRRVVYPGDQLIVSVNVLSNDSNIVQLDGRIHIGDKLVTNARLIFSLQDINKYYPDEVRHMTILLYKTFLKGAELKGVSLPEG